VKDDMYWVENEPAGEEVKHRNAHDVAMLQFLEELELNVGVVAVPV